jgi:FAD/FMN-containing dehydrogenase/Fe-S oxidoreductase
MKATDSVRGTRHTTTARPGDRALAARLEAHVEGEVLFDAFSRGRYATDASIYQIEPLGVVVPRSTEDCARALEIAADADVAILPRGAGSSQCGQAVGEALIVDHSKHINNVLEFDPAAQSVWVEPGIVLDQLNAFLKPYGLWYPVDVSTAAQATIGGMAGNNSCGARSLRYGNMVHNVLAAEAWLTSGEVLEFGTVDAAEAASGPQRYRDLVATVRALYAREREEIAARVPKVLRRVAGYNLDLAADERFNMAHLLVGSEGTLGFFRRIKLKLAALPRCRALGVVHFPTFYEAMDLTQHIVRLEPTAVELVDRTMIGLARDIAAFRAVVERTIRGAPDAILLVEFTGETAEEAADKLRRLVELVADLGLPGAVVTVLDAALQRDLWEVRKAGLNIMMSMKGDGKPVSFIEDCAVPLEHLADYTARLTRVFEKHGTRGTWYAHASVGCLHVRPVLDMRTESGTHKMRAIAEEACAMVREYKGSYSGEHGDGLVRSEWIEPVYGPRLARAFGELKQAFDPKGLMNPGKIVSPSRMDDRTLFRFKPGYETLALDTGLDWSEHEVGVANHGRGFAAAVEMCNNNGHCRKFDAGTMCPSYRATRSEQHLTRGRANSLRLALSGQLGAGALTSKEMYRTLELCVSCKGCKRECPTGVDMAAMKIEFLYQYHRRRRRGLKERLIAELPRYAPWASRHAALMNARARLPGLGVLIEKLVGLSSQRSWPQWREDAFAGAKEIAPREARADREVALLADTFNTYFEPENLRAAVKVLQACSYRVSVPQPAAGDRPLCCGRTYLASGMIDQARREAQRLCKALAPYIERGIPIVGLEPACLLTLRDEFLRLRLGGDTEPLARLALLFEEFIAREHRAGRITFAFAPADRMRAVLHGHCHQKAFGLMPDVEAVLRLVPGLSVEPVPASCCGMAGSFGFDARHFEVSRRMAESALLPAIRRAGSETLIVADGTSCRQQIRDLGGREALHVVRVLEAALPGDARG